MNEPLAVSVDEACDLTRLRRTLLYACLKDGRLTRRKVGRRTLVTMASIRQPLADSAEG